MLDVVEREYGGAREGEMWVANDPYVTGTHLNDVTRRAAGLRPRPPRSGTPRTRRITPTSAAALPGSMPADAADLFAEGLVVPPMRLVRDDRVADEVVAIVARQLAHARRTQRRSARADRRQLHRRAAAARALRAIRRGAFEAATSRALDDSEARTRDALRALGDGTFEARDYLEDRDGRPSIAHRAAARRCATEAHCSTTPGRQRASGLSAQRRVRRHALGRALRAARGHRSDDSDERGLLSSRPGVRAGGIACSTRAGPRRSPAATSKPARATPTSCCKRSRAPRPNASRRAAAAR